MDEGRKVLVLCIEMCFLGWLNEVGSIKGINQLGGCLGFMWVGLFMRQKLIGSWIFKVELEMFYLEDGFFRGCLICDFVGWS